MARGDSARTVRKGRGPQAHTAPRTGRKALDASTDRSAAGGIVEIRLPNGSDRLLGHALTEPTEGGGERVCMALLGSFSTDAYTVLCVSAVRPVPDTEYRLTGEGTAWTSAFTSSVLSEAMKRRAGVLMVHSHGFSEKPALSSTDEGSFTRLLSRLQALLPDFPHASVVVGAGRSIGGKVAFPQDSWRLRPIDRVRWIDDPIQLSPPSLPASPRDRGVFDRQELLLGQHGQALLNGSVLGIVGLGGGGSHVVQQAVHAGFGTLLLVDHDKIEATNMSRLAGAVILDVGRPKTEVFSSLARQIRPDSRVLTVEERFPSESGVRVLRNADVVVSCVDSLAARVELQKFSWRYLVPLVDIGIGTRLTKGVGPARAESVAGHVHVYLPGGPCMWCTGLLSREKLDAESGGRGPEYVEGVVNPAQVVSFNGVVASMAITEAMQLVTGFLARSRTGFFRTYDATTGELFSVLPRIDQYCPHGADEIGLGAPHGYSKSIDVSKRVR